MDSNSGASTNGEVAPDASLLGLPRELRDHIYHEALLDPIPVRVGWVYGSDQEPGLLRVCRLIRSEARAVFFDINTFEATLDDQLLNFDHWIWNSVPLTNRTAVHTSTRIFSCLKWWLRQYYDGREEECEAAWNGKKFSIRDGEREEICWPIFETVKKMRDLPWERVEVMLEGFREVMNLKVGYYGKWQFRD